MKNKKQVKKLEFNKFSISELNNMNKVKGGTSNNGGDDGTKTPITYTLLCLPE